MLGEHTLYHKSEVIRAILLEHCVTRTQHQHASSRTTPGLVCVCGLPFAVRLGGWAQ